MSSSDSTVLTQVGARLRELRRKLGISQEELAERASLHRTYVGGIERGERNVAVLNLVRLAAALKVEPAELLVGINEET